MKIHFIAVGGAVMHNMAIALKMKGYQVSGSDDEIFEPALSNLSRHGILPEKTGWQPDKITSDLDAVILGMHAKKGNPELDKAIELGLKIYSFPAYLYEQSKDKTRVVIAGSHGKTTITSMVMHVLKHSGKDFDYLVGAKIEGFDVMVKLTNAPIIVIEGDEYLTSALDLRPKFLHYKPNITLISGIAWDHINVFPDYDDYKNQFDLLIGHTDPGGGLFYCSDDDELADVVDARKSAVPATTEPYHLPDFKIVDGKTYLTPKNHQEIALKIFGNHNLQNLEGARLVCENLDIPAKEFYQAISTFKGAAKRLEKIGETEGCIVYKDFAHAPSKLKATVQAVRAQYPDRKLIAVMELHTFSSLSQNFLHHYRGSLQSADVALVFYSNHALQLKKLPELSPEVVKQGFDLDSLIVLTDADELADFLKKQDYCNAVLLLMSSGNFGGLSFDDLVAELCAK